MSGLSFRSARAAVLPSALVVVAVLSSPLLSARSDEATKRLAVLEFRNKLGDKSQTDGTAYLTDVVSTLPADRPAPLLLQALRPGRGPARSRPADEGQAGGGDGRA